MMMRTRLLYLLVFCAFAAVLHGQAPPSFRQGVLAFEKREWKNAEALMREAIAGNPTETEGTVQISGQWYETYVPHYFLARALAKQKKCAEALKEFAESERQGVSPTIEDFERHLRTRGGCQPDGVPAPKQKVVLEATVPFGGKSPTSPTATVTPAPVPVKPPIAVPNTEARDAAVRKLLGATAINASNLLRAAEAESGDAVADARNTLAAAVRAAIDLPPNVTLADVEARSRVIARASDALQSVRTTETRTRLVAAANSYLHGRYDEALRVLSATQFGDPAAAAEAALLRAASRHALYRIGGEQDAALRAQIEADLRQYRVLRPNGAPDPRMFSAQFVAMTRAK
jgi:hypothetical protein